MDILERSGEIVSIEQMLDGKGHSSRIYWGVKIQLELDQGIVRVPMLEMNVVKDLRIGQWVTFTLTSGSPA